MDRNFKNYFVWEEPGDRKLVLEGRKNLVNTEEIQAIFDTQITNELATGETALLRNASIQISTELQKSFRNRSIKIYLDVAGSPPYTLIRDEREIETNLRESDFPFVDQKVLSQSFVSPSQASNRQEERTFVYEIKSRRENIDTAELTVELN